MGSNGKNKGKQDKRGGSVRPAAAPTKSDRAPQSAKKAPAPAPPGADAKPPRAKVDAVVSPVESAAAKVDAIANPVESAAAKVAETAAEPVAAEVSAGIPAVAAPGEASTKGAAWGEPIARFEARWTRVESWLITFVLLWQLVALVSWVFLNGLSESVSQSAGVVFRAVLFAVALGLGTWFGFRRLPLERRRALTLVAIGLGLTLAPAWRESVLAAATPGAANAARNLARLDRGSADYFDNIKGWLQEGSTLTLMGGLRGLGTRLTLWLALLGGSLATAAGKHIHIDIVFRFLPKRLRTPAAIVNYLAAAAVCFAGAWGFFDHIAIESYGSRADDRAGAKIANAVHSIGDHLFFTRKQIGLDLRSLPRVLGGVRYDQWMTASRWNEWVDGAGYEDRFAKDRVPSIKVPADNGPHVPLVLSPKGENTRGLLNQTLGLVFPFGLLAIALRFLLRATLTLSGHLSADPDEAHKEEIGRGAAGEGVV